MAVYSSEIPRWLSSLLSEEFFSPCLIHEDARKNVFCFDCCQGICPHCFILHCSHRLLQIRRYVYHDVIRLVDGDKLMECDQVQAYTTNKAKVVFLKPRPQSRPPRAAGNLCIICDRNLQESYLFCSLSCKLQHVVRTGGQVSHSLPDCDFLAFPEPGMELDGQLTLDTLLEDAGLERTESRSSSGCGGGEDLSGCHVLACTATTEVVRKKRSNLLGSRSDPLPACGPDSGISESMVNRRKGTPHRSPLY